jgi:hypothetical protein
LLNPGTALFRRRGANSRSQGSSLNPFQRHGAHLSTEILQAGLQSRRKKLYARKSEIVLIECKMFD